MKILIVDDENISRRVLVKKMEALGECVAVNSSRKALAEYDKAVAAKAPYDLITLDVSMPGLDGQKVLETIRKKELKMKLAKPDRVKIIMVTARMNMSTIKACIRLGCNGYILKPVSKYQLLENLGKMGFDIPGDLKETDRKNSHTDTVAKIIERFYGGRIKLPVFPHIVREIQDLLKEKDASIDDLEAIIKKDITMSSKLISVANSPVYKGFDQADNLSTALVRLGVKAAQGVISAVAARQLFDSKNQVLKKQLQKLWMHSFAVACLGKELAKTLKIDDSENIFLMGIVHDIGKMLLMKAYADISPDRSLEDPEFQTAIHEIHTTFGAALLKKMRFSGRIIQVVEFHHFNSHSKKTDPDALILSLADHLAYAMGFGYMDYDPPVTGETIASLPFLKDLELDADQVMDIGETVKSAIKESEKAF